MICEGFRASDGYVVVQIVREHQFFKLAEWSGHPEWKDDPRFATRAGWGPALEAEIRPAVDAWASTRTKLAAAQELTAAGIVAGPSNHAPDVIADPHLAARHMIVEMPRTDGVERAGARARQPGEAVEDDRRSRDRACRGSGSTPPRCSSGARPLGRRGRRPPRPRRDHVARTPTSHRRWRARTRSRASSPGRPVLDPAAAVPLGGPVGPGGAVPVAEGLRVGVVPAGRMTGRGVGADRDATSSRSVGVGRRGHRRGRRERRRPRRLRGPCADRSTR